MFYKVLLLFELVYGNKCNLPSNLTKIIEPLYNFNTYLLELKCRLQVSQNEARNNLLRSKLNIKTRYDRYVNSVSYSPNDLILIKNETGNKLSTLYSAPIKVIKVLSSNVNVEINRKIYLIHKNRTKPCDE